MFKRSILTLSGAFERTFQKGKVIGDRYRIEMLLGTGGYGHSYLAFDLADRGLVVLKTLRLHKRLTVWGRKSFETEQYIMQQTNHRGLPAFYGNGIYRGIPYFTMEYKVGKNFEQLIFHEGMSFKEQDAFGIAYKLLGIVGYLHELKIIHRDIRIPNVLMDNDEVYLIDLGLAQKADMGQVSFPGSHRSLRKAKNRPSDFYGLGHFLLFLLYSSYSPKEGQPEKSWEEELRISPKARKIIRRLLLIESEYTDCLEIRRDIEQILCKEENKHVVI
ncbi:serine/threonine protein kinase [Neobacillus piezotolerans]|uniref:non-specific serine/threonine protein kinase n=1 Tax=Neobacillus piezotolerans TaxID=2259171 RepID=A0A3D8GQ47_9BACI|nr:protein kinase [Neobacillus piezotolerans]RDU36447.1 serine/threonine protein kinase [Neobacillus piezotolerans]